VLNIRINKTGIETTIINKCFRINYFGIINRNKIFIIEQFGVFKDQQRPISKLESAIIVNIRSKFMPN